MESRLAEIERLMQDPTLSHSDQQLLDQELDELLQQMDFRAMGDLEEPPEDSVCDDCGAGGHLNRGTVNGEDVALCDICIDNVEDTRGCGNCSGCAYCMVLGDYEPDGEV